MSNIYIQEPPSSGKVLLVTSVGDIDIELWSKEAPKACRNFVQLCMEGYYNGTIFHRVVKGFIVQGGDPTGSGHGGESIWGKPFRDEFHSRLRFNRRGLVAMANAGKNDNSSQFFFTLAEAPELNNKHTIFGKVTGNTVYNMIKLEDCETDANEKPVYPLKIIKAKILSNPFDDIIPRMSPKERTDSDSKKRKSSVKATKNFKLLSFGEEAEADEEETVEVTKNIKDKHGSSKSSHDLLDDSKLSTVPVIDTQNSSKIQQQELEEEGDTEVLQEREESKERIRKKLKTEATENKEKEKPAEKIENDQKLSRSEELRREVRQLKKELKMKKMSIEQEEKAKEEEVKPQESDNDLLVMYKEERKKYKDMKKNQAKKGSVRESATLALLAKFESKLHTAKTFGEYNEDKGDQEDEDEDAEKMKVEGEEEEEATDMSWMSHTLKFDEASKKVIDANIQDVDRYDIVDPRNPLNQRRREASKQTMKNKR